MKWEIIEGTDARILAGETWSFYSNNSLSNGSYYLNFISGLADIWSIGSNNSYCHRRV
ncbi:hypothetical protein [Gracilibacillus ureilyticus]|uniref:hypothetical protein n=1 Tax=Gracilibacillus ureilyticus TaxID=531814 RepID=UPI0015870FC2|nr:hypothetical protein [Gracilibacillus ureilyticus]